MPMLGFKYGCPTWQDKDTRLLTSLVETNKILVFCATNPNLEIVKIRKYQFADGFVEIIFKEYVNEDKDFCGG